MVKMIVQSLLIASLLLIVIACRKENETVITQNIVSERNIESNNQNSDATIDGEQDPDMQERYQLARYEGRFIGENNIEYLTIYTDERVNNLEQRSTENFARANQSLPILGLDRIELTTISPSNLTRVFSVSPITVIMLGCEREYPRLIRLFKNERIIDIGKWIEIGYVMDYNNNNIEEILLFRITGMNLGVSIFEYQDNEIKEILRTLVMVYEYAVQPINYNGMPCYKIFPDTSLDDRRNENGYLLSYDIYSWNVEQQKYTIIDSGTEQVSEDDMI